MYRKIHNEASQSLLTSSLLLEKPPYLKLEYYYQIYIVIRRRQEVNETMGIIFQQCFFFSDTSKDTRHIYKH